MSSTLVSLGLPGQHASAYADSARKSRSSSFSASSFAGNVEKKRKFVCVDVNDIPDIAIVDPEMMSSMPKSLTAATGMDALTHAIEGYTWA